MTTEDSGNYMCQVNTDPMIYQSAWLSVMIPPDIDMEQTSGDITAREHEDTAQLSCQADGVPRPRIVWRYCWCCWYDDEKHCEGDAFYF